jgi:hypothetical protein
VNRRRCHQPPGWFGFTVRIGAGGDISAIADSALTVFIHPARAPRRELRAVHHASLGQHMSDMTFDRTNWEVQPARYLLVRQTLSDQPDDVDLALADF